MSEEQSTVTEEDTQRDVVVPLRVYKTVTVFSTLIAVVAVVAGFMLLDAASLQAGFARSIVGAVVDLLGVTVTTGTLNAVLAVAGLAAIAGASITPFSSVGPQMGLPYLLQSFFAIITGGTGTLLGIIPGSIVVGGFTNTMTYLMQPIVAQTIIFVIVILIILVRPKGILSG
jgi:branched-subunit amino acid ABC-type transport system permease component